MPSIKAYRNSQKTLPFLDGGKHGGISIHEVAIPPAVVSIKLIYFIPSSESSAYLKQIKCILSAVKKYRIFSLVTDTIFIFSL